MPTTWLMMENGSGGPAASFHPARLESVGRYLPETRLSTDEVMASTRHRTRVDLERLTGIRERRVTGEDEDSLSLAVAAATDCLNRSRHSAGDIQALASCSITKSRDRLTQWLEPSQSSAVAQAIGARDAVTFDVSNACAGMLTGVFVMADRVHRGEIDCGMVVSGEYISHLGVNAARHVKTILSKELASLTLGDAGAAVIIERAPLGAPGIEVAGFTTVSGHSRLCLAYPARHHPGARMFTDARAIQRAAIADTPFLLREALHTVGLQVGDVDHLIPHQTSVRAIRKGAGAFQEALGDQTRNAPVITVDRYGNTASTTHFVALAEELKAGRIVEGDRVALLALASGLEIGLVLLTIGPELVNSHVNDA
ncbi:hypothetical protein J4573_49490 [Actinomadura barringtoniae]|uniref:3-oxoacyl-ACP synthase n=1 Tax=Actinomadura barringtoniae TaxID=1427535 RepID=A0A939T9I7_9ACTN|nr:3-oxoacyl-[acyl-carrier-protein] synthase III C-terminal domain-containing protein [Actinomadura barringtoniae]MBO2455198.1 hypothetical protein [Actinomadura barringtoniae]